MAMQNAYQIIKLKNSSSLLNRVYLAIFTQAFRFKTVSSRSTRVVYMNQLIINFTSILADLVLTSKERFSNLNVFKFSDHINENYLGFKFHSNR